MQKPHSAEQHKEYLTFVKGIVTEANPLTFPENASIDEDNMVLNRDGSRQRRLGLDFEIGHSLVNVGITDTTFDTYAIGSFRWDNVSGDPTASIGVVQVGPDLWFVDLFATAPSANLLNSSAKITLTGRAGIGDNIMQFTVINGDLVVSGSHIQPIRLIYDAVTDSISTSVIEIDVRDFWGVPDGLEVDESPETLSDEHYYNLLNQGWSTSTINSYASSTTATWQSSHSYSLNDIVQPSPPNGFSYRCILAGTSDGTQPIFSVILGATTNEVSISWRTDALIKKYPTNVQISFLGKNSTDDFVPSLLDKQLLGTSPAPKGRFVIDFFNRSERPAKVLASDGATIVLNAETENSGFRAVTSFSGRVFYAGLASDLDDGYSTSPTSDGIILFSQIDTESNENIGKCYQSADPTSEEISDLIDTDGGYITIPNASRIFRLIPVGFSLVVIAENGVWALTGGERGFTATEYSITQVSDIGAINAESIVNAEGAVFYWSKGGIYVISPNTSTGGLIANNITQTTIQTLYNGIPSVNKSFASGDYDEASKRVTWLYNDAPGYDGISLKNKYNREIILDVNLQAFYPSTIGDIAANSPFVAGYLSTPGYLLSTYEDAIVVNGDPVVAGVSGQVYIFKTDRTIGVTDRKYLTFTHPDAGTNYSFTLSEFTDIDFLDWKSSDTVGVDASAFLITGHDILGDTARDKQTSYITMHFQRTETTFVDDGSGNIVFDRPSSCLWQARWEWSDSASGRWGPQFQAYRFTRPYISGGIGSSFDYGHEVITTKNKVRGKGKAISFRIDSEAGKDMHILGWAIAFTGNTRVYLCHIIMLPHLLSRQS